MKLLLSILSFLACSLIVAQNRTLRPESFRQDELSQQWIIVKYKPQSSPVPQALPLHNGPSTNSSLLEGMMKVPIPAGQDPIYVCNQFLNDPNVEYAEPVIRYHLLEVPSDPLVGDQYYLDRIKAYDAWDITKGDDDIAVAIIDSGIDLEHEDLAGKLWVNALDPLDGIDNDGNGFVDDYFGYDFADGDSDPTSDVDPHGTRVAGVAGAATNNSVGMAGVGFNTKVAAIKGFSSDTGEGIGLYEAIVYAADQGIEVLNLSWGSIHEPLQSEQDIIDYAVLEKDVVVVAAAGNDGTKSTAKEKFYPASYNHVLSVAGSTSNDSKWSGSSYNSAVDLVAPASGILTTSNGDGYATSTVGTSFASPMVAAAAALVKDAYPSLSAQQIMERVRVTADDIYEVASNIDFDGKLGKGRLNAFRALNEGNLKSLRAENITATKANHDPIFFGDTIHISMDLVNYLSAVTDPGVYLSSPEDQFSLETASFFPGALGTLQNGNLSFDLVVSSSLSPQTTVDVRMDFQDGSYTDFQLFDFETAPDYAAFGNDVLSIPVTGDGRLGIIDYFSGSGNGLIYGSDTLLQNVGIMLATNASSVSDNILSDFETLERENDFTTSKYFKIQHHPFSDRYAWSTFQDDGHNLQVEQNVITSDTGHFVINRYRLVNSGSDTLSNLSFGVFADWDLRIKSENYAQYDASEDYLFARDADSTLFAGTKIIGDGTTVHSALDLDGNNGNTADLGSSFPDSTKYRFLVTENISSAGEMGTGNDVATLNGITIDELHPNTFIYVDLILAVGGSQTELATHFQHAQAYLSGFLENPNVLETVLTCAGGSTVIDPTDGDQYIFFRDALGMQVIDTASILAPIISSDTSFYVRNLDGVFASEISEIRIRLFEDFSNFAASTDTLYLDHPTTNVVQFLDQSIRPISWSWDFGEGTQSTLQNPTINFSEPGSYDIHLTVENEFGCLDTHTRTLVVAQRPDALIVDPLTLCPNEVQTLAESSATTLFLYSTATQQVPIATGASVPVGPFANDTTIYLAGRVDGLLTVRSPVLVQVNEVTAEIFIIPDTTSVDFRMQAVAVLDETSSVQWTLNGVDAGAGPTIGFQAVQGINVVDLSVTAADGCTVSIQEIFEVSTSAAPNVADITGCTGSDVLLKPDNGEFFGFYADSGLDTLLGKGAQLLVSEARQVYVVNLDDGLPGDVVQASITFDAFEPTITFRASMVGGRNKVDLAVESDLSVSAYQWYIGGQPVETSATPSFFFNDEEVELVLEAVSLSGCVGRDTLVLDFTPPILPLGIDEGIISAIYPNPSSGIISLDFSQSIEQLLIRDLSGKVLLAMYEVPDKMDLSQFESGIYLLEALDGQRSQKIKLILD